MAVSRGMGRARVRRIGVTPLAKTRTLLPSAGCVLTAVYLDFGSFA